MEDQDKSYFALCAQPPKQVDMTIQAGRMATRLNPDLNGFLRAQPGGNPLAAIRAGGGGALRRIAPIKN